MILRDDINERAEARVGVVLKGKWRLDSVIGIGGMATVYAATHRNRSRVAIKMLHSEVAVSQDVTSRFLREGYVGNAVAHPGTVKVLDDDVTDDGAPFLVMDLLDGESLGARLDREGPLPPFEVALLADQLLDVLAAAHAARIVHRDLKPDNVFLTLDGRVKVLDFGIARLRDPQGESSAATQAGSLLGTPAFMAPEQALGRWKEVDERTDIWAVGATLFTLLSGRYVHEAEAVQEQLVLAATSKAVPLSQYAPHAPAWLCAVVDRALSFTREARFPDARSMQEALRNSAEGLAFPAYPLSAPGLSGPRSGPFTPRPLSSPSFSEGATLIAAEASVQAVARSAQLPAPAPTQRRLLALGLAAGVIGGAAVTFALWSRPPAHGQGGSSLPPTPAALASVERPAFSSVVSAAAPPVASAERAAPPATPALASRAVASVVGPSARPPTQSAAPPLPRIEVPALTSAQVAAADKVVKTWVAAGKKPSSTKTPTQQPAPPPEQRENLFDIRH